MVKKKIKWLKDNLIDYYKQKLFNFILNHIRRTGLVPLKLIGDVYALINIIDFTNFINYISLAVGLHKYALIAFYFVLFV